ncbi:MAG: phospho-N-acetylmuramoyl-pentapeptide-transferase [Spirochaetes bacterium]|jgi:phospho-N-acetylmuramoyl-pentapeptide-transferase|nr:phospho-N-acetylmuramoyl-pentapeptide-transferase [Spirochaetota bacterium]
MFPEFLYPLVKYFTPFNVFQYITFRGAYAAITALLISFILGPGLIHFLKRKEAGEEIREDGPETHRTKSGTPTMGGILIILAIVVSAFLWMDIRSLYTWLVIASVLAFGSIGFIDDYLKIFRKNSKGMRGWVKFAGQIAVSLTIALILYFNQTETTTLLYVPFIKTPVLDLGVLYVPFAVLLLVSYSNAVNLTDGLDGLATGLVMMVALTFTVLSYVTGRVDFAEYLQIPFLADGGELAVFSLALVGACVGFLWFNGHPAEIMMGDTGSLSLGGTIGVISMMIKKEILLVIVGGVFVLEVFSVVIQVVSYKLRKRRVFLMAPLHHHFELKGWAESKVVLRLWILGGLFALLSLSTLKIR